MSGFSGVISRSFIVMLYDVAWACGGTVSIAHSTVSISNVYIFLWIVITSL